MDDLSAAKSIEQSAIVNLPVISDSNIKDVGKMKDEKLPRLQYVSPYGDVLLDLHCDNTGNVANTLGYRLFNVSQVPNDQFYALKHLQHPETGLTFLTNRSRIERKFRLNLLFSAYTAQEKTTATESVTTSATDISASARRWSAVLDASS